MKTAYELAMERFGGGPLKQYTPEQKAILADIDSSYESQIVQAKFAAQAKIDKAQGDEAQIQQIKDELTSEIRDLEERRERKKEEARKSFQA